jgi:aspartate/methionine/tyrosine aminotransferase
MAERVITVGTASKELRMIGWRVGWIVAPDALIPDLSLVSMANVVTLVGIAQDAVAAALETGIEDAVSAWQLRRDTLLDELAGLPAVRPAGGWSLLLDGTPLGFTGAQMAERLLRLARVAATPMDGWEIRNGASFLRLVFSNEPPERLRGAGARIRAALLP